jgi:uncharacterized membrane protein
MFKFRTALCLYILFTLALGSRALAQGTYRQIDVPNAKQTFIYGINSAGDVVGSYQDPSGSSHGFLLQGGVYTKIDYPGVGAVVNVATGINDSGQIVGYFAVANIDTFLGFEYDIATKSFTPLPYTRTSGVSTYPVAINNSGIVGGYAADRAFHTVGFEGDGQFRTVIAPDHRPTTVGGLNNLGQFVVTVLDIPAISNYLFANGEFQPLTIPAADAVAGGLNDNGEIVGSYYSDPDHAYLGFIYENGAIIQILRFDSVYGTFPYSINNSGVIGGTLDFGGLYHGFTWTPDAPLQKN